jgi:cell wall assembly regulator SMI1
MMTTSHDIKEIWTRIERVLQEHVPDTAKTLAVPATDHEINEPGIAPSYGNWLQKLAQRLEDGDFEIDEYGYLRLNIE